MPNQNLYYRRLKFSIGLFEERFTCYSVGRVGDYGYAQVYIKSGKNSILICQLKSSEKDKFVRVEDSNEAHYQAYLGKWPH